MRIVALRKGAKMTVRELKEILKDVPEHWEVFVVDKDDDKVYPAELAEVVDSTVTVPFYY